jgi:hypothetical protein
VKVRLKSIIAGGAALAVATAGVLLWSGTANAATTPGWEPDASARGSLTFYNAAGQIITGGSTTAAPFVAFAVASGPGRTVGTVVDTKATLFMVTPKLGLLPSQWTGIDQPGAASTYPNPAAPANLASMTNPVFTSGATDLTLAQHIASFPETDTDPTFANMYEIRLVTSGVGTGADNLYYRTDILVTGTTWSVVFPVQATTTSTTISANPPSPANHGSTVTLTSTTTPAGTAGGVHFFDGTTDLGAATYNATTGVATLPVTPADGSHAFSAVFTPADTTAFTSSTSATLPYTVNPPGTPTATTLAAAPPSGSAASTAGTLSVTLTSTTTPVNTAGGVHFFDGSTDLGAGTYTQATGVATLTVSLTVGNHPLIATFTPTATTFQPSSSAILQYAVVGANSAAIPISAVDNTQPFAGSLVLQVQTGTAVSLTQVDPTTAAGHPVLSTDPTGHRHAWVFTGSLTGVSVVDTRPDTVNVGGHGIGWTLNGQASSFINSTNNTTYPAAFLGWTPALVTTGSDAEGTVTAGAAIASQLAMSTSDGLQTSKTFAKAAAGNGLGTQNVSSSFELRIPDTSPTGTYNSVLTVTLVSP